MRLFIALDISEEVRNTLRALTEQCKPQCREVRWARPEGFHITLKFIGHVDEHNDPRKLPSLVAALKGVAADPGCAGAVAMQFRGLGFFPNDRHPRFFWCGLEASPHLGQLASRIERSCEPLGFPAESRPFSPHLTLARLPESARCPALAAAAREFQNHNFGEARETAFHLFESSTKSSGAEYKRLETFTFAKESQ